MRLVLLALCLVAVSGYRTYHPKTRYIDEEYGPYAEDGKSALTGQAFLTLESGDKKIGSGETMYMVPVTTRSTEAVERGILKDKAIEPDNKPMSDTARKCKRTVQADQEGKLHFEKLPPGNYYVYCQITYNLPNSGGSSRPGSASLERTGVAHSKVTLAEKEEKSITVTR